LISFFLMIESISFYISTLMFIYFVSLDILYKVVPWEIEDTSFKTISWPRPMRIVKCYNYLFYYWLWLVYTKHATLCISWVFFSPLAIICFGPWTFSFFKFILACYVNIVLNLIIYFSSCDALYSQCQKKSPHWINVGFCKIGLNFINFKQLKQQRLTKRQNNIPFLFFCCSWGTKSTFYSLTFFIFFNPSPCIIRV
jgi:hypothetical protein